MQLTQKEVQALLSRGAGTGLELCSVLPADDEIARILCAFGNTRGGWLVVGAGAGRDAALAEAEMARIRLVADEDLRPPLQLEICSVSGAQSAAVLWVAAKVSISDERPHSVPGAGKSKREIIVRVGCANHVAQGATLNAMRSHRTHGKPKDALQAKILSWMANRARKARRADDDATPEEFSQAAKIGLRRASKAFINMEREGLLIGRGGRSDRMYALP